MYKVSTSKRVFTIFCIFFLIMNMSVLFSLLYASEGRRGSNSDRVIRINSGKVYDINENDALSEIEKKLLQKRDEINALMRAKVENRLRELMNPDFSSELYVVKEERKIRFKPEYSLPFDIVDHRGNVLFRKGHIVNPLKYVKLPFDLVFVDFTKKEQVECIKSKVDLKKSMVFVVKGDVSKIMREYADYLIYPATKRVLTFFRVKGVPTIVRQDGDSFEVLEVSCTK